MNYTMPKRRDLSPVHPCRTSRKVQRMFLLMLLSIPLSVQGHAAESSPAAAPVQGPPSPFEPLLYDTSSAKKDEPYTVVRIAREWHNEKLDWETGAGRSYLLPASEILLYEFLLNLFDRNFGEPKSAYQTNGDTIWTNLTDSKWVIDNDQFKVNQFLHPYGGSIYYGIARSSGLNFWES